MLLAWCVDGRSDFLKTTREEMAGTSFYMFWFRFIPEMFSTPSAAFFYGRAFVCFSARLAVHYQLPFIPFYGVTGNDNAEYNGCVSVRYNSLFISLPLCTKVHKTTTWNSPILHIWENVNYTTANFLNFFVELWSCLTYSVWDISYSIDKLNEFKFSRDS